MKIRLLTIIKYFIVVSTFQFFSWVSAQTTSNQIEDLNYLYLEKIQVRGNTVFDPLELEALMVPFLKKKLSYEQIGQIPQKITDLYRSNGYLTSGAFFPQQEIRNGVAIIYVVEGKLERVETLGISKLKENYLRSRLQWNPQVPLNVEQLIEKIQLLQQDILIEKIEAQLVAGSDFRQSVLLLDVVEASPWTAKIIFDNHNSANSGEFQGIANVAHLNLLGFRDRLELDYSLTEGFEALDVGYSLPLNTESKLSIEYSQGNNEITQGDFNDFGIRADADTLRLKYDLSLVRELNRDVALFIAIDKRSSNTFIDDDLPFSFTEGAERGRSRVTALRLGGSWSSRDQTFVTSAQTQFSLGLDLFDATVNDNAPDGLFFSWLGQLQLVKALNRKQDALLVARLATQLTPDSLLPLEQIAIGGASRVRGYRENRGVGDNGIFGTVEVQLPIIRDSVVGDLKLVPFFDVGRIWNNDNEREEALSLASVGLGWDWKIKEWLLVELDFGIPLIETSDFDDSLQDKGFHFQLQLKPF